MKNHQKIVCIEEHVKAGGLGEKLKALAFDNNINVKFHHYHLQDNYTFYGSHEELLKKHGIDIKNIERKYE